MARKIRETYFIKNNANDNVGMTAIFYSDGTYSIVTGVTISGFKNFFNKEVMRNNPEARANIFDGSRSDVQRAFTDSIQNRREVRYGKLDSPLYRENIYIGNRHNNDNNNVDLDREDKGNGLKYALGGAAVVAGLGALGGAAYVLNKNKDDKTDSMEGKDWNFYLENAKESSQKTAMTKIYDILEHLNASQNWMRINDGTGIWGLTPEQMLSMYTYFNDLSTEELAQIYNGETVNVDKIMEEANQGMIAMSFFYANDTVGDTTIADLFNDQASKNVISDFTRVQARYNRATNDKERTEIAKVKKQMYYDYFINNSSSKYVDVSSVPGASFVINTMFPVDFVRYFRSSADLGEYDEILVTGRVREDGTVEHRSKVDSACGNLKADLEKYNEDIRELKAEYNAKMTNGFMKFAKETEYEKLTKDVYDPQVILDMMNVNLKNIYKYPVNVNSFNSTIDGERRLIAVGGSYSSGTGSSSYTSRPSGGGAVQTPPAQQQAPIPTIQEITGSTPEEAAKKAIEAGAPPEMVNKATQTIIDQNKKAEEDAWAYKNKHDFLQDYYDDVFNGDMDKNEAMDKLKDDFNNGKIDKDQYDNAMGVIKDADSDKKEYEDGWDKDGTIEGGEVTNKGSEVNPDGSIDVDLNGDGQKEHIPAHDSNDKDNPYNMPDYAPGAFDVDKNNADDEVVFDDKNAPQQDQNNNIPNTSKDNSENEIKGDPVTSDPIVGVVIETEDKNDKPPIEQNQVSDEELGDMTFSGGATSVGTSGGEVTDFNEDQLVDQVKESVQNQEVEIDGSIVSPRTGGEEPVEVVSFTSFAQQFYDKEAQKESLLEVEDQEMSNEPVKTLK